MEINNIVSFISSNTFVYVFIAFIIVSYLILALCNWSLLKPFKYIGISLIVIGILLVICKFISPILVNIIGDLPIPDSLLGSILKPLLIRGIIYIVIGIILIILQHLLLNNKPLKAKKKTK